MSLYETINEDLKQYMKSQDSFKLGVVRMLKGAMQLEKKSQRDELTDEEIINVVSRQIKMRKESIIEFEKAGRIDLVAQNNEEIEILKKYLPEQLSEEEVIKIIDGAFSLVNPTSIKDMGLIMKEVSPKLKGKADMGLVNQIIKNKLNGE